MEYKRGEVLLQSQDINLSFGSKVVLKDINFTIHNVIRPNMSQGQVISLVGKSGCGKTQLLRILGGLNTPTSGQVVVSIDGTLKVVKSGDMGLVPQDYYLFEWRKIREILNLAVGHNKGISKDQRKDLVDHYVGEFGLVDNLDKYPRQLSGGQRQRVSIAQQLLNGNKFLLMDEPFSGLDSLMIDKTTQLINKVSISDEEQTIFIVSHDLSNSIAISDTVIVISNKDGNGSSVVEEIDLMKMGLAWDIDIKRKPEFQNLLSYIKTII
jgi:ABC-type nitrate/sulfonate/bicarbonate transport system ATPase subunit